MVRLSAVFVAICMALIAGSLGAVLYFALGLGRMESALVGVAALTALGLYNAVSTRLRDRSAVGDQIADLSRGTADLARQVGELGRRVAILEAASRSGERAVAIPAPVTAELEELSALVQELAQSVAAHEAILASGGTATLPAEAPPAQQPALPKPPPASNAMRPSPQTAEDGARVIGGRFKGMEHETVVALIRKAVETSRIDLYLQPIVTLPQRKVRFYEAVTRLRLEDGELVQPADFLPYAERGGGLMAQIDNLVLFRCVQVVRRLQAKNRDIGLFCNISVSTLVDPEFFPQFTDFMEANRALAPALVLELSQAAYRGLGPIESESLAGLADQGFRFSLDRVTDLRLEPRDLAERGFRFLKVPAALLLGRDGVAAADIHPADFASLLARFGIEMIAERIESESAVVDLLDYDVKYAQGFLFSPPRPIRPEVMQGVAERKMASPPEAADVPGARAAASASAASTPAPGSGRPGSSLRSLARGAALRR
ncbi:MAG TPA: EAL domain-containing protein [Xanthobacteraceae bacterium]|jgi:cyclic-di-GMP phosphodiesterase TipF (flagellum assembly factor)|nr:EAL domain-containing protein [Xanthobacteraceae bacterium]